MYNYIHAEKNDWIIAINYEYEISFDVEKLMQLTETPDMRLF